MIANPRPAILELCTFFELECFTSYVDEVIEGLISESNHPPRKGIDWRPDQIETVERMKTEFPEYFFGSHLV